MAEIKVNRLTNANIYANGTSFLGRAEEIQLPSVKAKYSEHKGLGMIMGVEFPSGFEMMSGKIKWSSLYPDVIENTGSPYTTVQLQVRANLETYNSLGRIEEQSVVCFVTARFKDILPQITFKMNDPSEQESEFSATYYRLEIGGVRMVEVDALAQIFFVKESDQLLSYRINLGL